MGFWVWVFIILIGITVIGVIALGVMIEINTQNKIKAMEDHLCRIIDFSATQKVIGLDGNTGLAIDEERKKICLLDYSQQNVAVRLFSYSDLLSSEIFEDGITVTKTVRSSQIGGALAGGLAFGGMGTIIGGISGKTQRYGNIESIDLRLTVNDTRNPLHCITFLDREAKKDGFRYKQAFQQARHWYGLIEVLIKRADLEDKTIHARDTPKILSGFIADELKKLAELRDRGILSNDEFQQQKMRLLVV